ncbi:putative adhesin [Mycolicibacterium phocaicum]|uniref:putative adhesin n=1 Tax=Mycolicibacterium phocaicum TaxID=319706 RepID=UPI00157FE476|nr:hypothetical protein [Mycolicibacterium phocaicum]UCZ58992.1 hypothetical protein LHJ73_19880 [Mycolicibacterium phocaicum]
MPVEVSVRIEVEPQALISAGAMIKSVGEQLSALSGALSAAFSSGLASGIDGTGLAFGLSYEQQAETFATTLAKGATAFKNIGFMVQVSGYNYLHADQASTVGGPGPSGTPGDVPSTTDAHLDVHMNMGLVPPPPKWFLVEPLLMVSGVGTALGVAMAWPTGDSGLMKVTAAQWHNINTGLNALQNLLGPARTLIAAQKIPEAAAISSGFDTLDGTMKQLVQDSSTIATKIDEFAAGVQQAQDGIRRILDRLTSFNTLKDLLTGKGKKVLEEVARDASTLLNNFQRQVKALTSVLDFIKGKLSEWADRLEKWLKPTLVSLLGEEVGGAIADYAIFRIDLAVGVVNGVIGTVSGVVAMADPDTWKGMADLATALAEDPSKIPGTLLEMGKQFIAYDAITGDHPGRGIGEAGFNIASMLNPSSAASKAGMAGKVASRVGRALDSENLVKLGDKLSDLSGKTTKLNELDHVGGLGGLGSKMPEVPEFKPGAMPGSPDAPRVPTVSDPPSGPRGFDGGSHDPPGPDHTPVKGDGGGGHSERPTGPTDSGPRQHDAPTNSSSNGPAHSGDSLGSGDGPRSADGPRSTEPPATNHTPSGDSPSAGGQHSPESSTRPNGADEGRAPSAHDTPSARDTGGHATNDAGHGADRGTQDGRQTGDHTPNADHRPNATEHGGRSESHSPTEHQPTHEPRPTDSAHDRNGQPVDHSREHSSLPDNNPAERHDSGTASSGLANAMGAGLHGPTPSHGPSHSPAGSHTPTEKPDSAPQNRATTNSASTTTERPQDRSGVAGPARDTNPSPPVKPAATQANSTAHERNWTPGEAQTQRPVDRGPTSTTHHEPPAAREQPREAGAGRTRSPEHHADTTSPNAGSHNVEPRNEHDVRDASGLSPEKRAEILATEKGSRPDPSEYLSPEYIAHHLDQFKDGATRFMPHSNLEKYGIAQRDGTSFVMPKSEADAMLARTGGDPRAMERELGLPEGFLDSHKLARIDIPQPGDANLRVPSGNEAGANDQWIPGGKLPDGASEAVIDGGKLGPDRYNVSDVNADGHHRPQSDQPTATQHRSAPYDAHHEPYQRSGDHENTREGPTAEHVAPDGRTKISGHGIYSELDGHLTVPPGTTVRVFAEHGAKISEDLGNLIETGGDFSRVYSRTFEAGDKMPNYTLLPPDDLDIKGNPYTVDRPTQLNDLLRPGMGIVDYAACLGRWEDAVYDVDRIYNDVTKDTIHRYDPPLIDNDDW